MVLHCAKIVGKMNKTRTRSFIWTEYSNWMNFLTAFMKKLLTSPTIRFALLFFDKLLFNTPDSIDWQTFKVADLLKKELTTWQNTFKKFTFCLPSQKPAHTTKFSTRQTFFWWIVWPRCQIFLESCGNFESLPIDWIKVTLQLITGLVKNFHKN